jgi:hypothetical protein
LLDCTVDQQALDKIILRVAQAEARQSVVLPNQSDGPACGNVTRSRRREVASVAVDLADWQTWWKRRGARELRRILMEEWDPIQARGVPEAADEYDGYLGPLAARLREGASADEIASYLTKVEEVRMGLGRSPAARERNTALAARLRAWYAEEMAVSEE